MKHLRSIAAVLVLLLATTLLCVAPGSAVQAAAVRGPQPRVMLIELHDTLQPERASVFRRQMEDARRDNVRAVLINFSTPGGLADATDGMVRDIRQSSVPVIVWCGTPRTRITGEGLRLIAAADISLMHPGTFLTPLWTEHTHRISEEHRSRESQQLTAALNQDLQERGRSAAIVEELASGAHWFSAQEALQANFIDGLAQTTPDALRVANGRTYVRDGHAIKLDLTGARIFEATVEPQETLMLALMNPDLSVLLLTLGLLLIYLEINTPGTVIPGAAGILLVLLAAFALHMLPLNPVGVLLCLLAAALLLLEARVSAHGFLAIAGVVALAVGLGLLVRSSVPQLQVEWGTAVGAALGFGGVTATLVVLGMEARRAKVKTGSDAMLGWLAVAQTELAPEGHILVRGELWRARLTTNDSFVAAGDRVKVLRADGLTLEVTAIPLSNPA